MTDDDLDLLASAYLDGEATSEEVALVERDPQLLARVEELRAVSEQVASPIAGPSAELKEQHLAAALSAFTLESGGSEAEVAAAAAASVAVAAPLADDGDVIDLTARSRGRRSRDSRSRDAQPQRKMPTWLPAAAALMLLGGGGAWLISQGDGFSSDDSETAALDTDAGEDSAAAETDSVNAAASEAADSAEEMMELDEAMDDEAMEEEDAMEADGDAMADDADASSTGQAPAGDEDREGGLFPNEPLLKFSAVPSAAELPEDLPELRSNLDASLCSSALVVPDGQAVAGYLPIEIAGELAELFILVDGADEQRVVVVGSDSCEPLQ